MTDKYPVHHLGTKAQVLLTSVFGPYAQDDEYGSSAINPMELYHNQVTRVQGVFSLRMFHRSFGLLMIKENIEAPCTLLDFPDLERFIETIRTNRYHVIGIGSIIPNVNKVKKMCELIRTYQPGAVIVVGGHISNMEGIDTLIDADHIVRGDGIKWFRQYLGQDMTRPVRHPAVASAFGARILGQELSEKPGDTAAIVVPSVGCPMGCNFCSTSALFGGKGKFNNFYETGEELYAVMADLEEKLQTSSFFILDENFLLHQQRALGLLEQMKAHNKSWALYVFSSAKVLRSYRMEQLVELGISWVWMGLEGKQSQYVKLAGIDTRSLIHDLQDHGIRVLGSSIIGLEGHSPENIDQVIDYAVSHATDFHQFMLYTANQGTPLYTELKEKGALLPPEEFKVSDSHGQFRFNHRHPHIPAGAEEKILLEAFEQDFKVNGPSLSRLIRTILKGWQRYASHPDNRIRNRYLKDVKPLRTMYAGAVWAMKKWYRHDPVLHQQLADLLQDIYTTLGWQPRLVAPVAGRSIYWTMKKEERRFAAGWTLEPKTFFEKNQAALALAEVSGGKGLAGPLCAPKIMQDLAAHKPL
ncbi:B12-binding domain-containing radical SAM protein [Desulfopila sp. IMCC35006]|uniref:B12-binding domain-containing radical SAM protein n=1 Tax=Desulfopila sp. IMCC35006 TaxID=2569542 RepID=UPI0010AD8208|nr:cobalamin-dependent protein [Desulfopila sp. IMCC35006]TKB24394.1 B12-binding domain-containing radical SAM protein [Desulfopila sp. IMCC35006]